VPGSSDRLRFYLSTSAINAVMRRKQDSGIGMCNAIRTRRKYDSIGSQVVASRQSTTVLRQGWNRFSVEFKFDKFDNMQVGVVVLIGHSIS